MAIDVEAFYRRYGPMVLRRCRRLLKDEQGAQDAMQDVFEKVLRYEDRLEDSAPSSLLFRIATNVCLNRLRSQRRRPEDRDDELLQSLAAAEVDLSPARQLLARILGNEPASTATLAVWHYVDGMTLEEVAREAGMSVSGVRKRLRGLKTRAQEVQP